MANDLLRLTDCGLFCEAGGFYIDPWKAVDRAVITHAHSDHARWGMGRYLCASESEGVLRLRLEEGARIEAAPYGQRLDIKGVKVSLHPAGHILGSAQIRIEKDGYVAVVSGDYKTDPDPTCSAFEPLRCHLFVTESTFGLPIYRWPAEREVFASINAWWRGNQEAGKASLLMGYALGKAQRALAGVDASIGPIFEHGSVRRLSAEYRRASVALPETLSVWDMPKGYDWSQTLIVAPPGSNATPWARKFGDYSAAFMSGWMAIRGTRRRRAVDRGFVLSDHVDWPALLSAIEATGAEEVWVTHGYTTVVAQYLREQGLRAEVLPTHWEGEQDDRGEEIESEASLEPEAGDPLPGGEACE